MKLTLKNASPPRDGVVWSLQVLRFFAALMVVYGHAADTAWEVAGSVGFIPLGLVKICSSGVDIFFVTSGFIIAKIASGRSPSEFIWSRFGRIVPLTQPASVACRVKRICIGTYH